MNVSCTQARRQRSNASGSIGTSRRRNVPCKGGSPVTGGHLIALSSKAAPDECQPGHAQGAEHDLVEALVAQSAVSAGTEPSAGECGGQGEEGRQPSSAVSRPGAACATATAARGARLKAWNTPCRLSLPQPCRRWVADPAGRPSRPGCRLRTRLRSQPRARSTRSVSGNDRAA